jgi:hypothetical protein
MKCSRCHREKPVSKFYANSRGGLISRCKKCFGILSKARYKKNKKVYKEWHRKRWALIKETVLRKYGKNGGCVCCGITNLDFLSLDHIKDNGAQDRRKNKYHNSGLYLRLLKCGFPKGFQTLCHNCQWGKRINKGFCPHHPKTDLRKPR